MDSVPATLCLEGSTGSIKDGHCLRTWLPSPGPGCGWRLGRQRAHLTAEDDLRESASTHDTWRTTLETVTHSVATHRTRPRARWAADLPMLGAMLPCPPTGTTEDRNASVRNTKANWKMTQERLVGVS
ncbi:hypothetical protein H1C71_000118 [Ictidomys tridecemlineatus]|nr:hypothetical protein H1C71_000118 [Ictidomys tridecemlineatus]